MVEDMLVMMRCCCSVEWLADGVGRIWKYECGVCWSYCQSDTGLWSASILKVPIL